MNLPFDTTGLCTEEIDRFHDTYKALNSKFEIETTGHIDFHLDQFETFKNYLGINLRDSFVIKHLNCDSYLFFIETQSKNSVTEKPTVSAKVPLLILAGHDSALQS